MNFQQSMMKKRGMMLGAGVFVVAGLVAIQLARQCSFLYAYVEQFRLFQCNAEYALRLAGRPGGPVEYLTTFLLQFFSSPWVGALSTVLLWLAGAVALRAVYRRVMPRQEVPLLYLVPGLLAIWASFDFNYHWESTLSLVAVAWALAGYVRCTRWWVRWVVGVLTAWLLYYLTGPAWLAFWLCACLFETGSSTEAAVESPSVRGWTKAGAWCVATLLALLPAVWVYLSGSAGAFRLAFLPDAYTNPRLSAQPVLYALWASLPVGMLLARCGRNLPVLRKPALRYGSFLFQVLLAVGLLQTGIQHYRSDALHEVQELDYYARHRQWDAVLSYPLRSGQNALHAAYQNLALAEKGVLAEQLLHYPQVGTDGLCPSWNRSVTVSALLSDIYYAMGQIGLSQRMAFEGMVSSEWAVNPRLLLRLVQTNLIFGHHAVARRYVRLLEATSTYRDAAAHYRAFLDRDEAVDRDPELGAKRRFLQGAQGLTNLSTVPADLLQQVQRHPEAVAPFDYVCAYCLLTKDVPTLQRLLEAPVDGETVSSVVRAVRPLPVPVQEALVMMYENKPEVWASKGVTDAVAQRFAGFRRTLLESKGNPRTTSRLRAGYGRTFWYDYLFRK